MTSSELDKYITQHKPLTIRYFDQKSYKIGENAAILQLDPQPDPDNRIPVPFIRRATKLVKGYFAKVGNITYADKDGWFEEQLADIFDSNNEELETASMFEDSICYGRAFELHWFEGDPEQVDASQYKFKFAIIPTSQCIPIYSDDLIPRLEAFIWYRNNKEGQEVATWYDDQEYQEYRKGKDESGKNGEWELDPERSGKHLYGRVPVLEANTDRDKRNLFDHCLPLIDIYDKIVSIVGNEHEKFAQSILLLRDYLDGIKKDDNGLTDVDKVNQWRIMDKLGDNVDSAAKYLERNVNDTFISNTLDRFERLIYEMLCLFNPDDESFGTSSGIAQAYKLLGFEYLIADMESYFSQFLQDRIKLISEHKSQRVKESEKSNFVTINFKRNLPFDLENMATVVSVLSGGKQIISSETLLGLFPSTIIPDVKAEAEKVKEETPTVSNPLDGSENTGAVVNG